MSLRRAAGLLEVDAELAELDDRGSAPADRVGREWQHERHPIRLAERFAVTQHAVVPGRRLDGEAHGLESADEFANVLPHRAPKSRIATCEWLWPATGQSGCSATKSRDAVDIVGHTFAG